MKDFVKISLEKAKELFKKKEEKVYLLYDDDTTDIAKKMEDIVEHNGNFGIIIPLKDKINNIILTYRNDYETYTKQQIKEKDSRYIELTTEITDEIYERFGATRIRKEMFFNDKKLDYDKVWWKTLDYVEKKIEEIR